MNKVELLRWTPCESLRSTFPFSACENGEEVHVCVRLWPQEQNSVPGHKNARGASGDSSGRLASDCTSTEPMYVSWRISGNCLLPAPNIEFMEGWRLKVWHGTVLKICEWAYKVKARFCWLNIGTYRHLMCPRASKTHVVIYDRASRSQTKASRSVPFWRSSRLFRIPTKLKITLHACSFYNLFSLLWPASRSGFCGSYRGFSSSVISSLTASVAKSVLTVFLNWSTGLERQISFVVCPF